MPRKYKKKDNPRGQWASTSLQSAIRAVQNGMSQRQASEAFGISKTTLSDYFTVIYTRPVTGRNFGGRAGPAGRYFI